MQELLKSQGKEASPEFYEPPSCPFYEVRLVGLQQQWRRQQQQEQEHKVQQ